MYGGEEYKATLDGMKARVWDDIIGMGVYVYVNPDRPNDAMVASEVATNYYIKERRFGGRMGTGGAFLFVILLYLKKRLVPVEK